jgi:hypothetical protein
MTTSRPKIDHESIRSKLDHHDVMIGHLDKRVQSLDSKIDGVGGGINDLKNMFAVQKGQQGLGTVENVRVIAMGGSIIGMSAAAIGFLVQAYNAPTITRLETNQAKVDQSWQRRDVAEQAEMVALRKRDQERADSEIEKLKAAIEDLKVRVGWTKVEIRR